jgi:hypothetical protein
MRELGRAIGSWPHFDLLVSVKYSVPELQSSIFLEPFDTKIAADEMG